MFQRSGALLVAAAVILEIRLSLCSLERFGQSGEYIWEESCDRLMRMYRFAIVVIWITIIIGTIIWAYGDFMFIASSCRPLNLN
jgi:hypothetical protein